jgi:hypothetical protein
MSPQMAANEIAFILNRWLTFDDLDDARVRAQLHDIRKILDQRLERAEIRSLFKEPRV